MKLIIYRLSNNETHSESSVINSKILLCSIWRSVGKKCRLFFSITIITIVIKFTYSKNRPTSYAKLRPFFHKVSFIINAPFSTFVRDALCRLLKLFAEASELFPYAVCQLLIVGKNGVLIVLTTRVQKDGNRRVVNREYVCNFLYVVAARR